MLNVIFERETTVTAVVTGRELLLTNGVAATVADPGMFDEGLFSPESTVILGDPKHGTEATWKIMIDESVAVAESQCLLVIATRRSLGGLHSKVRGAGARVFFNGRNRDSIGLKSVPDGHSDYFYRPRTPQPPSVWPFAGCATVYSWMCMPSDFRSVPNTVRVELDPGVYWDIDFVGLTISPPKRVVREVVKNALWAVVGAILGALAAKLF